jgi:hypothetical protein
MKLHQKKFYSSQEVDRIIEKHADAKGYGFSEALRHIVMSWAGELVTLPKANSDDPEYIAYLNSPLNPRD